MPAFEKMGKNHEKRKKKIGENKILKKRRRKLFQKCKIATNDCFENETMLLLIHFCNKQMGNSIQEDKKTVLLYRRNKVAQYLLYIR